PRQDQRYGVSAGLTYKLTRAVQVKAEVRHEWRYSNEPGNDYQATIGLLGLRWQPRRHIASTNPAAGIRKAPRRGGKSAAAPRRGASRMKPHYHLLQTNA